MKLSEAAKKVEAGVEETLTYCDFPSEHWTRIRTNNVMERLNREIRRRTRVVGCFPDGNSALMLVCARLRHVAGTQWGNKRMPLWLILFCQSLQTILRIFLDITFSYFITFLSTGSIRATCRMGMANTLLL